MGPSHCRWFSYFYYPNHLYTILTSGPWWEKNIHFCMTIQMKSNLDNFLHKIMKRQHWRGLVTCQEHFGKLKDRGRMEIQVAFSPQNILCEVHSGPSVEGINKGNRQEFRTREDTVLCYLPVPKPQNSHGCEKVVFHTQGMPCTDTPHTQQLSSQCKYNYMLVKE